ncbi:MAG: hypothetical protein ACPGSB_08200 [Opitutales bacterium]
MTTNTTGDKQRRTSRHARPRGPKWSALLLAAVVIHVLGVGGLWKLGFFDTKLEINREEARMMAEEAEQRSREREEREKLEKQDRKLREEDREDLESYEREIARKQLQSYIEELKRIDREMMELKLDSLEALEERNDEEYKRYLAEEIRRLSNNLYSDLQDRKDPDFSRFAMTNQRLMLRQPLSDLRRAAEVLVEDYESEPKALKMVEQAERNGENMQKLYAAAPAGRRKAEEGAIATGQKINRLARELAGLEELDADGYRDTTAGLEEEDPSLNPEDLAHLSPEELLELAKALEKSINGSFDKLRAARLAQQMNLPLSEAMEDLIQSIPPGHEALEFPLNPETFAELQALQDALAAAINQAEQMASRAGQQLASAQGRPGPPGMMPGMPSLFPGMGGGQGSSKRFNPFAGMPGVADQLDLSQNLDLTPPQRPSSGSSSGRDNAGNRSGGGEHMIAGNNLPELDLSSRETFIHAQSLPGHRFSRDTKRSGWVYLNTFYTIGPWENDGRIDWTRKHGPDPNPFMNIDLDAEYNDGKTLGHAPMSGRGNLIELDGKLGWRFVQTDAIRMTFPDEYSNGTYYAYTEVYFDESMDMDVLIASDDATTAWISNSHPAYNRTGTNCFMFHRETRLSRWILGESRKRIRFTEGLNRILVRLENGPQFARLSVLLSPIGALQE